MNSYWEKRKKYRGLAWSVRGVYLNSRAALERDLEYSTRDWLSLWALHSLQAWIKGAYGAICTTGSWSQRNIVALLCLWVKKKCSATLLSIYCIEASQDSPWCTCQAGRGRGRFLDGPYESFQWWSPALLSARSSLPAPALGSPSSSYSGHFEQLKENKGLGLASTMTCKWMT